MAKRSKRHRQEKPVELQCEDMFSMVFEQCPDAIFLADAETGAILNVNPAGCDLMAMPREELLGLHQAAASADREEEPK